MEMYYDIDRPNSFQTETVCVLRLASARWALRGVRSARGQARVVKVFSRCRIHAVLRVMSVCDGPVRRTPRTASFCAYPYARMRSWPCFCSMQAKVGLHRVARSPLGLRPLGALRDA